MRNLEKFEMNYSDSVSQDTTTYYAPAGYTFTTRLEVNRTTTLILKNPSGEAIYQVNTGTWAACFILGAGMGAAVTSYSLNPRVGVITGFLTGMGCRAAVQRSSEDGDAYIDEF